MSSRAFLGDNDADVGKRRELKLTGDGFTDFMKDSDAVKNLFLKYANLNFVELSESPTFTHLPNEVSRLASLTNLVLFGNGLEKLPETLGDLKKLKFLDVSRNALVELPGTIGGCGDLQTLIVAQNRLSDLPASLSACEYLSRIDASRNSFKSFPSPLMMLLDLGGKTTTTTTTAKKATDKTPFQQLADISLKGNEITDIPDDICKLSALKSLDLSENKIRAVPGELSDCPKLRDLQLAGNELSDRRFRKLIQDGAQKAILDYVKKNCVRIKKSTTGGKDSSKSKKSSMGVSEGGEQQQDDETTAADGENAQISAKPMNKIVIMPARSEAKIVWSKETAEIRPHALFCIIWDLDFATDPKALKEFLSLQTKLHENQCQRRVAATIATHDLSKIRFPITYSAKIPDEISIQPLGRPNPCAANELVSKLTAEAEQLRKEKKRHVYSGVHQYLYLVKDKAKYACLCDADGVVISFPPITNSDLTKISASTKDVLLEVTSDKDMASCKRVMEALIRAVFGSSLIRPADEGDQGKSMTVEQVKVETEDGTIRTAYPSKLDLNELGDEGVQVVREWSAKTE